MGLALRLIISILIEFMTNKFIQQYNYAEMSVLNVKSIKVTSTVKIKIIFLSKCRQRGGGGGGGGGGMIHFYD